MKNLIMLIKDYFKMPQNDEKVQFHLNMDVSERAKIGWKRYAAGFRNYGEAFESLIEVRTNMPPGRLDIEKKED